MKIFGKEFTFNGFKVYHTGNKPTATEVGAEPAFTKNNAFNKNFGTVAGTTCQGNDSRLINARAPTAHTHDDRYYTETEVDARITGASGNTVTVSKITPTNLKNGDVWIKIR